MMVYEVVFQTDESYYTLGVFEDKDYAEKVAATGNAMIDSYHGYPRLEIKPRSVIGQKGEWTRQDFIDALQGSYAEPEDYFLPEQEEE